MGSFCWHFQTCCTISLFVSGAPGCTAEFTSCTTSPTRARRGKPGKPMWEGSGVGGVIASQGLIGTTRNRKLCHSRCRS